jgi:CarD family transcriptional regulator
MAARKKVKKKSAKAAQTKARPAARRKETVKRATTTAKSGGAGKVSDAAKARRRGGKSKTRVEKTTRSKAKPSESKAGRAAGSRAATHAKAELKRVAGKKSGERNRSRAKKVELADLEVSRKAKQILTSVEPKSRSKVAKKREASAGPETAVVAPVRVPAEPVVSVAPKPIPVLSEAPAPILPVAKEKAPIEPPKATRPVEKPVARDEDAGMQKQSKPASQRQGFKLNEFVVYPAHGVGQIVAIEEQEVAGFKLELFVISFSKDKMTLRVPTSKVVGVGMRKLSDPDAAKRSLEILTGRARIKRTMWSRRAQEYEAKINSGDINAIAEVVRDLYRSEAQPEQSYSERQLYEAALDRMVREIAVVQKVNEIDALKSVEGQLQKGLNRAPKAGPASGEAPEGEIEEAA